MELPFEKMACRYMKQKLFDMKEQEISQELKLSEGSGQVSRILGVWGQPVLRSKEWRDRSIGISGGVMAWVLYLTEGADRPEKMGTWIPFQFRFDMSGSERDGKINCQIFLTTSDARVTGTRKIVLRIGVGAIVQAMEEAETQIYQPGELPDDLEVMMSSYPLMMTEEADEMSFAVEEELDLPAAMPAMDELVYYTFQPEVVEKKVMGSKGVFRGSGRLHLLYMDLEGKLYPYDFQIPFAQYVEFEGDYSQNAQMEIRFCVTELDLEPDERHLNIKSNVVCQYQVADMTKLDVLEDAYSPCRDVELVQDEASMQVQLDKLELNFDFSQQTDGKDSSAIDVCFESGLPKLTRCMDQLRVEMNGTFQLILDNSDGVYDGKSTRTQSAKEIASEGGNSTTVFIAGTSVVGCRKEANGWRTDTQVIGDLTTLRQQTFQVVKAIRYGQERPASAHQPSVIIRSKKKGERLWDIAKKHGSTVSAITRINDLNSEPEDGQLLLIPVL